MHRPALAFALLLIMACSSSHEPAETSILAVPESYIMRVSQKCFCSSELQGPFDIKVVDNQAVSVKHVTFDKILPVQLVGDEIPSLKSILENIEQADTQSPYQKKIVWLKEPFVPKQVYIDFYKNIKDEEIDITIESFKLL